MSSQLKLSGYGALATILTSLALISVFQTSEWMAPVWGAVLIVAGLCALVRMSPLPSAFEPIAAAVGVLLWVTALYAHDQAFVGFIPDRSSLHELGDVARSGFTEIHQLPTPAPAHHGLVMLTVVGVAAIALVVDLMTVTLRRAALAGLPLLALFTVCAATGHHGVGIIAFIGSAIGYLWLLYADNRDKVARWGAAVGSSRARPASAWSTDPASAPPPASLGRQVGAAAITVGLLVPLFIPGLHTGIGQHGSGGSGGGSGGGTVHTFDPIVKIGADLKRSTAAPVLTYTTTSSHPGYIRLTSLDQFDGSSFTQGNLTATAQQATSERLPVTAPPGTTVQTNFQISGDFVGVHWLPVETTALGVSLGEPWRYDPTTATIFSAAATSNGLAYSERSVPNDPTPAELSAAPKPAATPALQADLTLPTIAEPVRSLERTITKGAKTKYQAALDIQDYLTSPIFRYDTSVPADDSDQALYNFLFNTRRGFCQQFSTAMAVMARLDGIPSRVAVGFTAGKPLGNGKYVVTTKDAHAWPELWFQGYGWLPFEPTPRADGQAVTPSYAQPLTAGKHHDNGRNGNDIGPRGVPKGQGSRKTQGKNAKGTTAVGNHSSSRSPAASATWWALLILAALLVVLLVAPRGYRALLRRHRWRQATDPVRAPAAAWAEMRDTAVDRRAPWDDSRSPRQIAATLLYTIDATPKTTDSMLRLAKYEEQSRYAASPHTQRSNLRYDVEIVQAALDAELSRVKRWRAVVLPRSVVLRVRRAGASFTDRVHAITQRLSPRGLLRMN